MSEVPPAPTKARGRPTKKTPALLAKLSKLLAEGQSRRRASLICKLSPKTVQLWLRDDAEFRDLVSDAESQGSSKRSYLTWLHHPFRGKRPPRAARHRGKPYPKPAFSIGTHWRSFPRRF